MDMMMRIRNIPGFVKAIALLLILIIPTLFFHSINNIRRTQQLSDRWLFDEIEDRCRRVLLTQGREGSDIKKCELMDMILRLSRENVKKEFLADSIKVYVRTDEGAGSNVMLCSSQKHRNSLGYDYRFGLSKRGVVVELREGDIQISEFVRVEINRE
jgi:hypothetical protein